jgi:hypothetical protein
MGDLSWLQLKNTIKRIHKNGKDFKGFIKGNVLRICIAMSLLLALMKPIGTTMLPELPKYIFFGNNGNKILIPFL